MKKYILRIFILIFFFCIYSNLPAQTAPAADATAATTAAAPASTSLLEWAMLLVAAILAAVIYILGRVMLALANEVGDRSRKSTSVLTVLCLIGLSLISNSSMAQQAKETTTAATSFFNYGGVGMWHFWLWASVIIVEFLIISFFSLYIFRLYRMMVPAPASETKKKSIWESKFVRNVITDAVPVEQEQDILLDHDYDGIKELDNALPPWWKYGFYFTILVAVIYLLNFHVFKSGKLQGQEYETEMSEAKVRMEEYLKKAGENVDENTATLMDAAGIAEGKKLFTLDNKCSQCHGQNGEGNIGPNFTDNYWLHGGDVKSIFKTIKYGVQGKAMQAWGNQLSPKQIQQIASYIYSLAGTNLTSPRPHEGVLYLPEGATATDTTKTTPVKDSIKK